MLVMNGEMTIGQLARQAGVTRKSVLVYEREGLLDPTGRTPAGYRLYGPDDLLALNAIRDARQAGFGVPEIRTVMKACRERGCADARATADTLRQATLDRLDAEIEELVARRVRLADNLGEHERFRLFLLNADLALASGRVAEGIEAAREAMRLAQTPWQRGHALFKLAWLEYRGGDPDAQLEPLLASIRAFHDIGDRAMETLAVRNLSGYWFHLGDLFQHDHSYAQALGLASELEDGLLLRRLRADKVMVDWVKGDYHTSLQESQALYHEARERGDWWALWDALQDLLLNAAVLGLDPELEATAQHAMVEAAEVGAWRDLALLRSDYGNALMVAGHLEEARGELEAALRDLRDLRERARLGQVLFTLGFALLELGNLGRSQETLEESVELWRGRKEYRHTARSLAALALARLRAGNRKGGQQAAEEAYNLPAT